MNGTCLFLVAILAVFSCTPKDSSRRLLVSLKNELKQDSIAIPADDRSTLDKLLDQAAEENKNLFLVFGFEKCGWCKVFRMYHQDSAVDEILSRYFIVTEIDYDKTPDGQELYRAYGSTGFPSWTILDQTGKVLSDSEATIPGAKNRIYNVGYPAGTDEMSWYISSLKKSAHSISSDDCELLRNKLSFYHKN